MSATVRKTVELYYDVISPHAWITFQQLLKYKKTWDIDVLLKPFSLMGVQATPYWTNQSENQMKMQYINKDVELLGKYYGVPIKLPKKSYEKMCNTGTLTAMRLLTATEQTKPDLTEKLSHALWMRMWSKDEDISERGSLIQAGKDAGVSESIMEYLLLKSKEKCTLVRLRSVTEEALLRGVFTAPTMFVEDNDNKTHVLSGFDKMHVLAMLLGKTYEVSTTGKDDMLTSKPNIKPSIYDSVSPSVSHCGEKLIKRT